jgi:hypothetical protein
LAFHRLFIRLQQSAATLRLEALMLALLLLIGALLAAAIVAIFRVKDPHHEFMFDLVQLLDLEHRIGKEDRDKESARARHVA